jgi:hypothetical protein
VAVQSFEQVFNGSMSLSIAHLGFMSSARYDVANLSENQQVNSRISIDRREDTVAGPMRGREQCAIASESDAGTQNNAKADIRSRSPPQSEAEGRSD